MSLRIRMLRSTVGPAMPADAAVSAQYIAHRRQADGETQALADHLHSVGTLASRNAAKLKIADAAGLTSAQLADAGEVIGLLHDFGKYSESFQNYLRSAVGLIDQDADEFVDAGQLRGRIDHSTAGAQYVWRHVSGADPQGILAGQMLALCIASHHSGLVDNIAPDGSDNFSRRMTKPEEGAHLEEVLRHADQSVIGRVAELIADPRTVAGVLTAARSIAKEESTKGGSNVTVHVKLSLLVRFLFSCLVDADRADTASFERPHLRAELFGDSEAGWQDLIQRLETYLADLPATTPIDEVRRAISVQCLGAASRDTGIFTLTVPTGGGKTLSSLRFALHHARQHALDRVIYVIPFTSIIDQNADLMRRILEPPASGTLSGSIVLEHHSNLTPDEQTWRAKLLAETWNAPVVCTTSVQFLETLFGSGTRGARRMHQLANAVIVFDEVQTIPLRCVHLFNNAINFLVEHCGTSIVLCTATQPLLNCVDPGYGSARFQSRNEIIADVRGLFDALRRTQLVDARKAGGWTDDEIQALVAKEMAGCGSVLVIVNTRSAARSLYRACRRDCGDAEVFHLSTLMCPAHRRRVLATIHTRLRAGTPTVCISTQLIEAGIDVDFGSVIRFVAGMDSIAQAAGRCNRGGRRPTGRVYVVNPTRETIDRLNDIRVGRDVAERVLDEFSATPAAFDGDPLGPRTVARYFDYYFFRRKDEMRYPVTSQEAGRDDTLLNLLGENQQAVHAYKERHDRAPPLFFRQAFMTAARSFRAIDAPSQGIVVPYGDEGRGVVTRLCASFDPSRQFEAMRLAQQYSVNVFAQAFDALARAGAVAEIAEGTGIYHLRPEHYSKEFGLSEEPVSGQEVLNA